MNERIQELMDKAMVKTGDMSRRDDTELDPEKFAELIIRECLEQIDDGNSDHAGGNTDAINRIKEHFGVEG